MGKQRLIWADSLKGWLILLVILGHAIQNTLGDGCNNNHLWNLIYSFHMPSFMAVSGFLAFRANGPCMDGKDVFKTLYRRFKQLVIPFFMWSLLSLTVHQDYSFNSIFFLILYPDSGLWFLWALFWINVIFVIGSWLADLMRIKQEYVIISFGALLATAMVIFEIRVWGFQFIAFYFLFYSLGYYLNKYKERMFSHNSRIVIVILFVLWFVLAWNWKMHEIPQLLQQIPLSGALLLYSYRFMTAAIAVYLLLDLSPNLLNRENKWNDSHVRLGFYSLGIYAVHFVFIGFIVNSLSVFGVNQTLVIVVSFLLGTSLSWMIVWVLSKWNISAKWLLGKI